MASVSKVNHDLYEPRSMQLKFIMNTISEYDCNYCAYDVLKLSSVSHILQHYIGHCRSNGLPHVGSPI